MTTPIQRREFVEAFRRLPEGVSAQRLSAAADLGVSDAEINRIAGQDGVLRGDEEVGALYDRLAELDRSQPQPKGARPRLEAALELYRSLASKPVEPGAARVDGPSDATLKQHVSDYGTALEALAKSPNDPAVRARVESAQAALSSDIQLLGGDQARLDALGLDVAKVVAHAEVTRMEQRSPDLAAIMSDARDPRSVLGNRLKKSGLSVADFELFVVHGEKGVTPKMGEVLQDLAEQGDNPPLGIVIKAQTAQAAFLRASADALAADDPQGKVWRSEADAVAKSAKSLPEVARQQRVVYAGRLLSTADHLTTKGDADSLARAQRRREVAAGIYTTVGDHYRQQLAKHPALGATHPARKMAALATLSLGKLSQQDGLAIIAGGDGSKPLPAQLDVDRRSEAQVATDAVGAIDRKRSAEALFREAEVLDPALAKNAQHQEGRRDLRELRFNYNRNYLQLSFAGGALPKAGDQGPVDLPKLPPQQLLSDVVNDGTRLSADVRAREDVLDAKAGSVEGLDAGEWQERARLKGQGDRVAIALDVIGNEAELDQARGTLVPYQVSLTRRAGERTQAAIDKLDADEGERKQQWLLMQAVMPSMPELSIGPGGLNVEPARYEPSQAYLKQRAELVKGKTENDSALALLERQQQYSDRRAQIAGMSRVGLPNNKSFIADRIAASDHFATSLAIRAPKGREAPPAIELALHEGDVQLYAGQYSVAEIGQQTQQVRLAAGRAHQADANERRPFNEELEKIDQSGSDRANELRSDYYNANEAARKFGLPKLRTVDENPIWVERPANFGKLEPTAAEQAVLDNPASTIRQKQVARAAGYARMHAVSQQWTQANEAAKAANQPVLRYQSHTDVYVEPPKNLGVHVIYSDDERTRRDFLIAAQSGVVAESKQAWDDQTAARTRYGELRSQSAGSLQHMDAAADKAEDARQRLLSGTTLAGDQDQLSRRGVQMWSYVGVVRANADPKGAVAAFEKADGIIGSELAPTRLLKPKERESRSTMAASSSEHLAEGTLRAGKIMARSREATSGVERGRSLYKLYQVGARANARVIDSGLPELAGRAVTRKLGFDSKLAGVAGFGGPDGVAAKAMGAAKGGKERFDKKLDEVITGLNDRTQGSVSATSNAAMWLFSGGKNMRAGMRAADKDAMRFAEGDGRRTAESYELGMPALEQMGQGSAEDQYAFAGLLHDPRADTTGVERDAWALEFYTRADAIGLSEQSADAAYKVADRDPALMSWRDNGELDDFGALGALYTPAMGDHIYAPAYDTLFTTADILHKNHADLESRTKYLLLGIDAGIMVLGGEVLAPVSSAFAAGTGLARASGAIRAALGGGRIGNFVAGGVEGLSMLAVSKGVHYGAKLAGVAEGSDLMQGIDFASGAFGFNVVAKGTAFSGLLTKYAMNTAMMGAPVVAGEFMSERNAALVGDLAMVLTPAVLGAMSTGHRAKLGAAHAEAVLAHPDMRSALSGRPELQSTVQGVLKDPAFNGKFAETDQTNKGLARRRVELERRLIDKGVPEPLAKDVAARDVLEKAKQMHTPPKALQKSGSEAGPELLRQVDAYYGKLEQTMAAAGVDAQRVPSIAGADKQSLFVSSATKAGVALPTGAARANDPLKASAAAIDVALARAHTGEAPPTPVGDALSIDWHPDTSGEMSTGRIRGVEHVDVAIAEGDLQVRSSEAAGPMLVNGQAQPHSAWIPLQEGDTVRIADSVYARRRGQLERIQPAADDAKVLAHGENGVIMDNGDGRTLTKVGGSKLRNQQLDAEQRALGHLQQKGLDIGPPLIGRVAPGELIIGRVPGQSLDKLSVDQRKQIPEAAWNRLEADLGTLQQEGIHHNDVSAHNIMWDGERLRLIDFGLAEVGVKSNDDLTRARKIRQAITEGREGQALAPLPHPNDIRGAQKVRVADIPFEPARAKASSSPGAVDARIPNFGADSRALFGQLVEGNTSKRAQAVADRAAALLADKSEPVRQAVLHELLNMTPDDGGVLLSGLARSDRLALLHTGLDKLGARADSQEAGLLVRVLADVPDTKAIKALIESPVLHALDEGAFRSYMRLVLDAPSPAAQARVLDGLGELARTPRHGGERVAVLAKRMLPLDEPKLTNDQRIAREQLHHALERSTSETGALAMLSQARNFDDPRVVRALSRLSDQEWFMLQGPDDQLRGAKLLGYLYDLGFNGKSDEARMLAKNTVDQLLIADPPLHFGDMPPRTHGISSAKGIEISRLQISADGARMSDPSLAGTVSHEVFHHINMRTGHASAHMEPSYRYFMDEYGAGLVGETVRLGAHPTQLQAMEWVKNLLTSDSYKPIQDALLKNPAEGKRIVEFVNQFLKTPIDPAHPELLLALVKSDGLGAQLKEPGAPAPEIDPALGFITNNELSRQDAFEPAKTGAPDARSEEPNHRRTRPGVRLR